MSSARARRQDRSPDRRAARRLSPGRASPPTHAPPPVDGRHWRAGSRRGALPISAGSRATRPPPSRGTNRSATRSSSGRHAADEIAQVALDEQATKAGVVREPLPQRRMRRVRVAVPDDRRLELIDAPAKPVEAIAKRTRADLVHAKMRPVEIPFPVAAEQRSPEAARVGGREKQAAAGTDECGQPLEDAERIREGLEDRQ